MAKQNKRSKSLSKAKVEGTDPERLRLAADARREANWKRWGPYLAERQWGTVREDYSADGSAWTYFPHDHARSRAYRWGEDGLLGFTDRECRLCFAPAFWNGNDTILKERLFGLTGPEGNHGEDVKECYYYLDATPTHSYLKALYKYPQQRYPYARLVSENARRTRGDREFELADAGVFDENRYFDVLVEYAKASDNDVLIRLTATNRGPDAASLWMLPTFWFRNTWSWGCDHDGCTMKPAMKLTAPGQVLANHESLHDFIWSAAPLNAGDSPPEVLFTENETNTQRVFGEALRSPYVKDAFHRYVVAGERDAVNPKPHGTKAGALYHFKLDAGASQEIRLRLTVKEEATADPFDASFDKVFVDRIAETKQFYGGFTRECMTQAQRDIARQADAGLLWTKQFYHYSVKDWLDGDPDMPAPPASRRTGRNSDWTLLFNRDVISMPDKWEYPWYAAWDLAFHMLPFAHLDSEFAKEQLILMLREWYMHPNGQIPAYEFAFGDVNPPVHAWACWRTYKIAGKRGDRDRDFLARTFQKLLINFTWWVNRKDAEGRNLFGGGFLGLDNIGVFDRSAPMPNGGTLDQADGTAWMAFYCSTMLAMAMELAIDDPVYEDIASKFFEHYVAIIDAMNALGGKGLWDEVDGFYYDELLMDHHAVPLRVRSMVGLIPLIAVEVLDEKMLAKLPGFTKRMRWFLENRKDLGRHISYMNVDHKGDPNAHYLLAVPSRDRLERVLAYMLDEAEFLSPYGIRSLSKRHKNKPFELELNDHTWRVDYDPGESTTSMFGGNSNWRGPVWFPVNYLLIESLERYHHFYGDDLKVEFPTGSGKRMTLKEVARELGRRLIRLFEFDVAGRPAHGRDPKYAEDPHWRDLVLFYEYFDGDTGRGLGASHQTGWTALVTRLIHKYGVEEQA